MRKEVEMFAQIMEHKLKLNDHKGGWATIGWQTLVDKLRSEVEELIAACESEPPLNIMMEAADVANFAMMLAHNAARDLIVAENRPVKYQMTMAEWEMAKQYHDIKDLECGIAQGRGVCTCIPF